MKRGIEPALADVFDSDAVKAAVPRAQPEVVIEQLTALPKTYTRNVLVAFILDSKLRRSQALRRRASAVGRGSI